GVACFEERLVGGHIVVALRLGGLVATLAVLLEEAADVLVVADGPGRLLLTFLRRVGNGDGGKEQQASTAEQRAEHGHRRGTSQAGEYGGWSSQAGGRAQGGSPDRVMMTDRWRRDKGPGHAITPSRTEVTSRDRGSFCTTLLYPIGRTCA